MYALSKRNRALLYLVLFLGMVPVGTNLVSLIDEYLLHEMTHDSLKYTFAHFRFMPDPINLCDEYIVDISTSLHNK